MSDVPGQSRQPRDGEAMDPKAKTNGQATGGFWQRIRQFWRRNGDQDLKETLHEILEDRPEHESDESEAQDREILENLLIFGDLTVDDLMVPRADIIAVAAEASLADIVATVREARHSRLPVFRETLDQILGFIHIKDIVDHWADSDGVVAENLVHEILFAPPSMLARALLADMRAKRTHIAIVVDEFGGTDGLVTIEDLVEGLIGDIEDEHDRIPAKGFSRRPDGRYLVNGRTELEILEKEMGLDFLPDEDDDSIDTLGGLVISLAGHVPKVGEQVTHKKSGVIFEIVEADPRRVKRLLVHPRATQLLKPPLKSGRQG